MKKKTNSRKQSKPALRLRVCIQRGNVTIHLSVQTRWLAAALTTFGLLVGSEPLARLITALSQLPPP